MYTYICKNCNKEFQNNHKKVIFCKQSCYSSYKLGSNNGSWRGGKYKSVYGYIHIRAPKEHPFKQANGYIMEHRLIMEQKINRYLQPNELIHHINGIKNDNKIENLVLITKQEHNKIHLHSSTKICLIPNCGKSYHSLGYCHTHYQQYKFKQLDPKYLKFMKCIVNRPHKY